MTPFATKTHLAFGALPGKKAQREMAPRHRLTGLEGAVPAGAVDAGVLILLTPVNEGLDRNSLLQWKVLLIRRNCYPGVHSGQISFPGGKREPGDADLWETACREAHEETGVSRDLLEAVGPLTPLYVPPSNFLIHPFVGVNRSVVAILPDPREVVEYKNVPLAVFDPAAAVELDFATGKGDTRPAPAWRYEGFTIWGATAMILAELYRAIGGDSVIRF